MPTQMEIEYWRNRYQRMNKERFVAANTIALITHTLTQPLDLVKIRSQMLQEGKTFIGLGFQRGWYPFHIFEEIHQAGGGLRRFYSSQLIVSFLFGICNRFDGFLIRTFAYTTARVWGFLYFYDKINPDPRRIARPDYFVAAGIAGGFLAGMITNPVDIVFARMQVDELYPSLCKRNYKHFLDGIYKVADEGALFRGGIANGCRLAAICSSMTSIYDWCKENSYFFFGPSPINRFFGTTVAVTVGTLVSMPFDMIRVRLQTMRPLPNGIYPYKGTMDCLTKILKYECNPHKSSNFQSFYAGLQAYWLRLFLIAYLSQYILDYYHGGSYVSEFWQPARFSYPTGIDYDIHDPYTDAFNKMLVSSITGEGGLAAAHPNGKDGINIV